MRILKLTLALSVGLLTVGVPASSADYHPDPHFAYQWRIQRVSTPYQTAGAWNFCGQSHGGRRGSTVGCSRAFSVANTVTGSIGVSDGILSDTLGYNVTKTTTTTGNANFPVPAHVLGISQWRSLFTTRAVHQRLFRQACQGSVCYGSWQGTSRYATAYASEYKGPDFREIIRR